LKERFSLPLFISVLISLSGAMLVLKPSGDFFNSGGFFGLTAGILAAMAFITIRKLSRDHSATTIIVWFALISSLLSFPIMLNDMIIPSAQGLFYIVMVGVFSSAGQLGMTRGYKLLPAQKGSMTMLLNIVLSALISYFFLGEDLDIFTILGGTLVIVSSLGVLLYKPIFFHKHPNRTF
jgi:drug/metabolite transporter (DMT)-like permease